MTLSRLLKVLLPIERVVGGFLILALLLYIAVGIPLRYPWTIYRGRVESSVIFYLVALACSFIIACATDVGFRLRTHLPVRLRSTFANFRARRLTRDVIIHNLRTIHGVALLFTVFLNLKHLIPFIHPQYYDSWFADMDRTIFGGHLGTERFQQMFGPGAADILSDFYVFFYPYTALVLFTILLSPLPRRTIDEFFSGFAFVWFCGVVTVYLVPTLGPCFAEPSVISQLPLTRVTELQRGLVEHQQFIAQNPLSARGLYLISGFPSLHIAAPLFASFTLIKINRWLGTASLAFVWMTFISTLYFGWHYVLDDIGGVLLAVLVYLFNRRLFENQGGRV